MDNSKTMNEAEKRAFDAYLILKDKELISEKTLLESFKLDYEKEKKQIKKEYDEN